MCATTSSGDDDKSVGYDGPVFNGDGGGGGESSAVGQREIFTLKRGVTKFKHTIASPLRCAVWWRSVELPKNIVRVCALLRAAAAAATVDTVPRRGGGRRRDRVAAIARPARGGRTVERERERTRAHAHDNKEQKEQRRQQKNDRQ